MEQDGEKYYLGRSPDVSGFLVEAETLEEAVRIAPNAYTKFI
jgi:predicted RNase H-like HicB family nuclease